MYLATDVRVGQPKCADFVGLPLPLVRAERKIFTGGRPYATGLRTFFADLFGAFGIPFTEDSFRRARSNSFQDMAAELVRGLNAPQGPFDLAVIAHYTPDSEPGWPACRIADMMSDAPLAFAVSEQGPLSPFTALRLVADLTAADAFRRAIVLILDQRTLLYEEADPLHDCGVSLILDQEGRAGSISVQQCVDIPVADVRSRIGAEIERAATAGNRVTCIAGPGLNPSRDLHDLPGATELLRSPAGFPCTGSWLLLSNGMAGWLPAGRRVLLADYDEISRLLCLCRLDLEATDSRRRTG